MVDEKNEWCYECCDVRVVGNEDLCDECISNIMGDVLITLKKNIQERYHSSIGGKPQDIMELALLDTVCDNNGGHTWTWEERCRLPDRTFCMVCGVDQE